MINRENIKTFRNIIIGWIETDTVTGNKSAYVLTPFKLVGKYDKRIDRTTDYITGTNVRGDRVNDLIWLYTDPKTKN